MKLVPFGGRRFSAGLYSVNETNKISKRNRNKNEVKT